MADINLQPDERALLALMPDDGATIGNGKARESLGWEEERYTTAKEGLIRTKTPVKDLYTNQFVK